MAKKWTEEETELMLNCASLGYTPKEASDYLDKKGFSRTATAIPLKYAHVTSNYWPDEAEVGKNNKTEIDYRIVACLTVGAMIITYWWMTR